MNAPVSSSGRFRKSGLARSLVAVAAGTTAVMTANAAIVFSGIEDLSVNMTGATTNLSIDLTGSGGDEFNLQGYHVAGGDIGVLTNYALNFSPLQNGGKGGSRVELLASGYSVSAASSGPNGVYGGSWANVVTNNTANLLLAGDSAYIGFEFKPSGSGGSYDYGWAEFTRSADGNTLTLVDWAYENTGAAILTGAGVTPEPTTAALGMTGLLLGGAWWQQRRRARAN